MALKTSWQYDFKLPGHLRVRKGGYRTKQAALAAGRDWRRIEPELGYGLIEEIDTSMLDDFKQTLPSSLSSTTVNHHLILVRAILRFMWKRGRLCHVPYVPMEKREVKHQDWYTMAERDLLLDGMFRLQPQWYLFFYLTCRLGLRRGEVYAISHRQIRYIPPQLMVEALAPVSPPHALRKIP